jgi:large subunit ribosomal protein L18
MDKKVARLRRARQTRLKIAELRATRLTIYRSNLHIYASIIDASGGKVLVTASSNDVSARAELKAASGNGGNVAAAKLVGKLVAEKAIKAGISSVAFDRAGYRYHGRIKALAEAAREAGLQF